MRSVAYLALFVSSAALAQAPSPAVIAARQRQEALPSVEFVFRQKSVQDVRHVEALFTEKGDSPTAPPPQHPILSESSGNRLVFSGDKVRVESQHPIYSTISHKAEEEHTVRTFDGERTRLYHQPPDKPKRGYGVISDAREFSTVSQPLPFTFAARGLDGMLCEHPVNDLIPSGTATVRGRVCEQFRVKRGMSPAEVLVWLDPTAGYTLRRVRRNHLNGTPSMLIDAESSNANPSGVWLPSSFTVRRFDKTGKPQSTREYTVERVVIGQEYPSTEFDFLWPEGMPVEDLKTGENYVATADGRLWQTHWRGGPVSFWVTRQWWVFALAFLGWVVYRRLKKRRARKAAAAVTRPGVTLVELLVVIAILAILIGLLMAAIQKVRLASARVVCLSRMQQLGLAAHNHHSTKGEFPAGVWFPPSNVDNSAGISWQTLLLPYLEQDALWQRAWAAHQADPIGESAEHQAIATVKLPAFRCFADTRNYGSHGPLRVDVWGHPGWALNNYLGVAGTAMSENDGLFHPGKVCKLAEVTDGTSHTLMIGERPSGRHGYHSNWYAGWGFMHFVYSTVLPVDVRFANTPVTHVSCPRVGVFQSGKHDDPCHDYHFWSYHDGGANFAFADGSARFVSYAAAGHLPALATKAGAEVVSE